MPEPLCGPETCATSKLAASYGASSNKKATPEGAALCQPEVDELGSASLATTHQAQAGKAGAKQSDRHGLRHSLRRLLHVGRDLLGVGGAVVVAEVDVAQTDLQFVTRGEGDVEGVGIPGE